MRVYAFTGYSAVAILIGALACAGNPEPDEAAAARDTAQVRDTVAQVRDTVEGGMAGDTIGQVQTPGERAPSDTFLDQQGVGTPQDTAGYGGIERTDTTGAAQTDTTGVAPGAETDTTGYNPSQQPSMDTTGQNPPQQPTPDTTGQNPSQQPY
jgi:hypothetical protein